MLRSVRLGLPLAVASLLVPLTSTAVRAEAATTSQCVVSLSPTATETLYAIGAGAQVKAVDTDSNYPAQGLPSIKINAFSPSVEGVLGVCGKAATKPSLVVISYDANSIKEKLLAVGVKVVEQDAPKTLAGAYGQIKQLGVLTGHLRQASALVASMSASISASLRSVTAHPAHRISVYYELDPTLYSLTSSTFVGAILKSLGTINIADAKNTSADAGYPQLSAEYIVTASPNLIVLADTICCKATANSVGHRIGFSSISAVVHHHIAGLNDDVASRWGPRLPQLVAALARAVRTTESDPNVRTS